MPKISACIISLNEEEKIEDCLKSLEPVVDEIILVDSNSTDKTVEIASKYTDHVHLQDFLGYVQQKNLAVQKASHDWILVATAHPAKFETVVEPLIGCTVPLPPELEAILSRPSRSVKIEPTLDALAEVMHDRFIST